MRGQFRIFAGTNREIVVPNLIPNEAELAYLEILFQGNDTYVPLSTGNYYVGLSGSDAFDEDTTLATLPGELTSQGGYARLALARNATDWPTVALVNGDGKAESKAVTFSASGAAFSDAIRRIFLCNVATGTAGKLLAVSASIATPVQVNDGEDFPTRYDVYLR